MLPFPQSKTKRVWLFGISFLLLAGSLGAVFWEDLPFIHDTPQRPAQAAVLKSGQAPSPSPHSPTTVQPVANDLLQPPAAPDPVGESKQPGVAVPIPADGDLVKAPQENSAKPGGPAPAPVAAAPIAAPTVAPSPAPLPASVVVHAPEPSGAYLQAPTGNLRALTKLLADLEEIKVRVAIQEQEERMKKLKESTAPSLPQLILPPPIAQAAPDSITLPLSKPRGIRVLSIQGIDGNVAATLDTPVGSRTVKVGDRFGAGRVERISGAGVFIRDGKNTQLLPVEE